jgi:hypothetical protein
MELAPPLFFLSISLVNKCIQCIIAKLTKYNFDCLKNLYFLLMMQVYAYLSIQIHFCSFERADARTSGGITVGWDNDFLLKMPEN